MRQGVDSLAQWYSIGLLTRRSGFNSHQSHGNFFSLNCYALFFVTAFIRKMGACPGLDLIPCRNGLILHRNGFQVINNDGFMMISLKRGVLRPITLPYA